MFWVGHTGNGMLSDITPFPRTSGGDPERLFLESEQVARDMFDALPTSVGVIPDFSRNELHRNYKHLTFPHVRGGDLYHSFSSFLERSYDSCTLTSAYS